ncbi:MAG: hypothetical protein OET63_20590 [Desulfobacterales bacterium]|nr:hypothetical protein [Desulfobacterales bacterium]
MNYCVKLLNTVLLLVLVTIPGAGYPVEKETFSRANTELFFTDHLDKVNIPSRLLYDFRKTGTLEEGFSDTVEVRFAGAPAEEEKQVEIVFFTGERTRAVPPMTVFDGNPVVTIFLQREVNEMGRLTEGSWRHFQKMIKLALENEAEVTEVTVPYGDQASPGLKIRITPYLEDPLRDKFEKFAYRYYEFTLSGDVPGYVYQIRTVDPGNEGKDTKAANADLLVEETLTYRAIAE